MFKFSIGEEVYFKRAYFINAPPCECCGAVKQIREERIRHGVVLEQYLTVTTEGKRTSYSVKHAPNTRGNQAVFTYKEKDLMSKEEVNQSPNIWSTV